MTAPSASQTVNLTIEGRKVAVPAGTSILEAGKAAGVLIPHYCYHPGLPVAGVCRMCLVDVEKSPKLAPACATACAEGQVVHVHSDKALEARKGVLRGSGAHARKELQRAECRDAILGIVGPAQQ